jgi:hypothetical protein
MARVGDGIGAYAVLMGSPEGRRILGRRRPGGRILLKWILKK